jgi:hypothetical protein
MYTHKQSTYKKSGLFMDKDRRVLAIIKLYKIPIPTRDEHLPDLT